MSQLNCETRAVFVKDNMQILKNLNSECIDLIYLDPPFNKKKKFTAPIGSSADGASFKDWFTVDDVEDFWVAEIRQNEPRLSAYIDMLKVIDPKTTIRIEDETTGEKIKISGQFTWGYIVYMARRLIECHRILKPTGSIYLHCDHTMHAELRHAMDCIFGKKNFRNTIVWQRSQSGKSGKYTPKSYGNNTDTILFYAKSNSTKLKPYGEMTVDDELRLFPKIDENGKRYALRSLHCGRTLNPSPGLCFEWKGFRNKHPSGWCLSKPRMDEEFAKGNIVLKVDKNGNRKLERRQYVEDSPGKFLSNFWYDISPVLTKEEKTDYPTQKPLKLLERIILANSKKGDVVLDPFCGCATACVAAEMLGRKWVGIDISEKAYTLVKKRLKDHLPDKTFDDKIKKRTKLLPGKAIKFVHTGWVYVVTNSVYPGACKVGITENDSEARLLSRYNTGDPNRGYKVEWKNKTPKYREIEAKVHNHFPNSHEWVFADKDKVIKFIKSLI